MVVYTTIMCSNISYATMIIVIHSLACNTVVYSDKKFTFYVIIYILILVFQFTIYSVICAIIALK